MSNRVLGLTPGLVAAALPEQAPDPLKHEDADPFWQQIEPFFAPITAESLQWMHESATMNNGPDTDLAIPQLGHGEGHAAEDGEAEDGRVSEVTRRQRSRHAAAGANSPRLSGAAERAPDNESTAEAVERAVRSRLEACPLFQRLVNAFVEVPASADAAAGNHDQPGIGSPAAKGRGSGVEDLLWPGPADPDTLAPYHRALERRVALELRALGLIDDNDHDELLEETRLLQWQLRSVKAMNRTYRGALTVDWKRALKSQAKARELEHGNRNLQILYLERMIRKCKKNRRQRQRFERVLKLLYPLHRIGNLQVTRKPDVPSANGGMNGDDGGDLAEEGASPTTTGTGSKLTMRLV
ncbi:hypothetical protein CDCA_CDCA08G2503 [Cyanidium caldarium]|uniref:Uncharacterized protein n=1 Tax=Cyanidium caldarium TaxID=2771 RepID=A0AAV9IXF2_CYACA|nr:hypothetical protein CDCA_CDCA08G2503 [Cyanidium caldarium]